MRLSKSTVAVGIVLLFCLVSLAVWRAAAVKEPSYSGKRLSVWLDELAALQNSKPGDPNTPPVQAVRAIGTNAIPWLLSELKADGDPLGWRMNRLLSKQRLIKYRFPDINRRFSRAILGFEALGELGAPAIPSLLAMAEDRPGFIPSALGGIGAPALPALGQCLTNTKSFATSIGPFAPLPGNSIGALYNAMQSGRISPDQVTFLLPAIRGWAQSTNQHAARYAATFLKQFNTKAE